jgi:hypothetical protein
MGIGGKNEKQSRFIDLSPCPRATVQFASNISGKARMHGKKPAVRRNELSHQGGAPIEVSLLKEVSGIAPMRATKL